MQRTLDLSALGAEARAKCHKCLVGAFHGHAHNRLCQLRYLATYVKGLGLEDLEGCERFFSKSNALAGATRYASVFHRWQAIVEYCKHLDTFDTYYGLSKWSSALRHYY
jgi:Kyakuja-Dileera-Zisupton transposase